MNIVKTTITLAQFILFLVAMSLIVGHVVYVLYIWYL